MYPLPPSPFLESIVHDLSGSIPLDALCAGYESGKWRDKQFAEHLIEWLPEFSLSSAELKAMSPGNAVRMLRKAANLVYQTEKYGKRGEFGELLLHIALRQLYNTIPAISKIYWKDSVNTTVKGFDAVHVVANGAKLELWLGEVKFYEDAKSAITALLPELKDHTKTDYLRNEFMLITNKLDTTSVHYERLSKLLDPNTSLDDVFDAACIPVLITYDSDTVKSHNKRCPKYLSDIEQEIRKLLDAFEDKITTGPIPIKIHFFAIPLHTKKVLISLLDQELKKWQ